MQKLFSDILQALRSVRAHGVRSVLTVTGIIIGVAAVVLLNSVGKGAQQLLLDEVESLGSNIVFIIAGGDGGERRGPPAAVRGIVTKTLKQRNVDEIIKRADEFGIGEVSSFTGPEPFTFTDKDDEEVIINVRGRGENYFGMRSLEFVAGGPWSERDEEGNKKVAVIGGGVKDKLFGEEEALGERISIKGENYRIVGVLENKEAGITSVIGQDDNENIMIPVEVMQRQVQGVDYLFGIMFEVLDPDLTEFAIARVEELLRDLHNLRDDEENDFSIRAQQDAIGILTVVTDVFTVFLAAIASISLLVGGIGIMNIMLVTVTERTFEIGLRKALGARNKDILSQFLVEAVILTAIGGVVGVAIGVGGAYMISVLGGLPFIIDIPNIALAIAVASSFGLVFGIYPARRASLLAPVEALRYE